MSLSRLFLISTSTVFYLLQVAQFVPFQGAKSVSQLNLLLAYIVLGLILAYQAVLRLTKSGGAVLIDLAGLVLIAAATFEAYSGVKTPYWAHVPLGLQLEYLILAVAFTFVYFVCTPKVNCSPGSAPQQDK